MPRYRRRAFGFGRTRTRAGVSQTRITLKKRARCKACRGFIEVGAFAIILRLKKQYRQPCGSCGHKLTGAKKYHETCVPADINAAMGFDPAAHQHAGPAAHSVAPPPKPASAHEAAAAALVGLEAALIAKARERGITPEMEQAFKTYEGIKARFLRPGTPAEGEVAASLAIQRIVKLVF